MLFYTRCHYVAKGKITVYDTDPNSMKLEKWLLFEIDQEAYICTSMTATAILVLFINVSFLESTQLATAVLTNISRNTLY